MQEEGNVVSVRKAPALFSGVAQQALSRSRTRPSLNPETRATSVMGLPMQASRYRGRANSRK